MKKVIVLFAAIVVIACGAEAVASFTVATFSDPSNNSANPLFDITWSSNGQNGSVEGGWGSTHEQFGLTLEFGESFGGGVFENAWFTMPRLDIVVEETLFGSTFAKTGSGTIEFYEYGTQVNPLLKIEFQSVLLAIHFLAGDDDLMEANGDNVTFSGSQIGNFALENQQFSFGFTNIAPKSPSSDGFKATAAFTSSAVPEPATLGLLALGGIALLRRRRGDN